MRGLFAALSNRWKNMSREERRTLWRSITVALALLAVTGVVMLLFGKSLLQFVGDGPRFRAWVDAHGIWSRIAFVGLMSLQVVLALLPGEPFEIAAGYAFGFWEGTLLCIIGTMLAGAAVFLIVKRFGRRAVRVFFSEEQIASVRFLHDKRRLTLVAAILFLIPGTPKDVMTYCVGLTDMKLSTWLLITSLCRLPSVITSTIGGDALGLGNFSFAGIVFLITVVISGIGVLIYRRTDRMDAE